MSDSTVSNLAEHTVSSPSQKLMGKLRVAHAQEKENSRSAIESRSFVARLSWENWRAKLRLESHWSITSETGGKSYKILPKSVLKCLVYHFGVMEEVEGQEGGHWGSLQNDEPNIFKHLRQRFLCFTSFSKEFYSQ